MRPASRSALRWLPLVLLSLGIAVHGFRVIAHHEDPQRGTAFAMFATIDIGANRRVVATSPGDPAIVLDIPGSLEAATQRLADTPNEAAARRLASQLLALTWTVEGHTATAGGAVAFDQVRVQVVGLGAEGRTVSRMVVTDVVVEQGGS